MPLGDLLTIAVLTPAQAVLVTADLLQAAGGPPPERIHAVLRTDGAVDVTEEEGDIPGVPLPELMGEVVRNARRLPAHPRPHQLRLLRYVEEQAGATGDPAERASALREAITKEGGAHAIARTRRELAALVEAFNGMAASRAVSGVQVNGHAVALAPVARPTAIRPHGHVPRRVGRRRARTRRILVILVVLAMALVGGGYLLLRGPGSGLVDHLRGDSSNPSGTNQPAPSHPRGHQQTGSHAAEPHAAEPHRGGFPTLAAHSSGQVRSVVLQKVNGCAPGTACGVTVTVHLAPASVSQVIGWRVGVARNCARPASWSPETTVTAQPGWSRVFASSSVQIPQGRSLALVALTSTPTHAQSRPIAVGGTALHC